MQQNNVLYKFWITKIQDRSNVSYFGSFIACNVAYNNKTFLTIKFLKHRKKTNLCDLRILFLTKSNEHLLKFGASGKI